MGLDETGRLIGMARGGGEQARYLASDRLWPRILLWSSARVPRGPNAHAEALALAENVVAGLQEAFLRRDAPDEQQWREWLFGLAERCARRRRLASEAGVKTPPGNHGADVESTHASGSDPDAPSDGLCRMCRALVQLSEPHREVIRLRRIEGYDASTAAVQLGLTEEEVGVTLVHALRTLKGLLANGV